MKGMEPTKRDLKSLLPRHEVGDELRGKIEDQLTGRGVMPALPQHRLKGNVWPFIVARLDAMDAQARRRKAIRMVSSLTSAAAAVVVALLLSGVFATKQTAPNSVVVHTEEVVSQQPVVIFASQQVLPESERISAYCTNFPSVCQDPEFVQLKTKWTRLKNELAQLHAMASNSDTEQVNHYIARIQMDIKQLEDKMMHKFL